MNQSLRKSGEETLQEGKVFRRLRDEVVQMPQVSSAYAGAECLDERLTFGDDGLQLCFQRVDLNLGSLGMNLGLELFSELQGASLDGF